jgi:arsenate reductase
LAIRVLEEQRIDISQQRSKSVDEFANERFDYVITLCTEEVCPIFLNAGAHLHWPLPDPAAVQGTQDAQLDAFRRTANELTRRLNEFVTETTGEARR